MLTAFGTIAVSAMLIAYWQEPRSKWWIAVFAGGSAATATYSGFVEAWPVLGVEALWSLVALRRFWQRHHAEISSA